MSTPIPTVPEVLNGAADLIERHGIAYSQWESVVGCLCMLAAVAKACDLPAHVWGEESEELYLLRQNRKGRFERAEESARAIADHLAIELPSGEEDPTWWEELADWSDQQDADTVVEILRETAEGWSA